MKKSGHKMIDKLKAALATGFTWNKVPADALTTRDYIKGYQRPPSIVPFFHFQNYDPYTKTIQFKDGNNGGILFEVESIPCEARTEHELNDIKLRLFELVKNGFIESENPWICQIINFNDDNLTDVIEAFRYSDDDNEYQREYKREMVEHLRMIESKTGIFKESGSKKPWRGTKQRVYMTLFRQGSPSWEKTLEDLADAKEVLISAFDTAGINHRVCEFVDYVNLLLPWLTPNMKQVESLNDYLRDLTLPDEDRIIKGEEKMPLGLDIGDFAAQAPIESLSDGVWKTGDQYQVALPVELITAEPKIGHLTRERNFKGSKTSLFEQLPFGTRWVTTLIIQKQTEIKAHLKYIDQEAVGNSYETKIAAQEVDDFYQQIANQNKGYSIINTVYLKADSHEKLLRKIKNASSILRLNGLPLVDFNEDIFIKDDFIRNLPFNFDSKFDAAVTLRKNLAYADHIASLIPLYGREKGTESTSVVMFNAGGEPITFDPIKDKQKNAHADIFGPSGGGKSAFITAMIMALKAAHDLRVVIVDPKHPFPSFSLLADYFKKFGLKVVKYSYDPKSPVPTPPFKQIRDLFDGEGRLIEYGKNKDNENDLLGQLTEIAMNMVIEDKPLTKPQKAMIGQALILAGQDCYFNEVGYPLIDDLIKAFYKLRDEKNEQGEFVRGDKHRDDLSEFAESLKAYTAGLTGEIFNKPGKGFKDADLVLIELAALTQNQYSHAMVPLYMSIIQNVLNLASKSTNAKDTLLVTDEDHMINKHGDLTAFKTTAKKIFRSAGIWMWNATQDFDDVPDSAKKMINNSDWFFGLTMPDDEINKLKRIRTVKDEEVAMIKACNIEKGKYSEAVILSNKWSSVVRLVLPPTVLALAQTEKDERVARLKLMEEEGIRYEVDAALAIAEKIKKQRMKGGAQEKSKWQ